MILKPARRVALVTAVLAAVAAVHGCAPRPPRHFRVVAAPGPRYTVAEGAVSIDGDNFHLTLVPLDDLGRAAFIKARVQGATDPFSPGPGGLSRYLTFRLTVENRGAKDPVVFQPRTIYLASDIDRYYPLDFPEAYSRFFGKSSSDPRLLDDLSKYLFDVGVSVDPGKRAEGLLVYPVAPSRARKLRMEFSFLSVTGTPIEAYDIFFNREALQ